VDGTGLGSYSVVGFGISFGETLVPISTVTCAGSIHKWFLL
jgi:hypothetical protein